MKSMLLGGLRRNRRRAWQSLLPGLFCLNFALTFLWPRAALAATIKINEFVSHTAGTTADPDWVEIYYLDVDASLYRLVDVAGNTRDLSTGTCSSGFCEINWSNRLNNDGDTIKLVLISSPDSSVDQVIYGVSGDVIAPTSGQSAGRSADGVGGWVIFSSPTKGATNNSSSPVPTPVPTSTPTAVAAPTNTPTPKPTNTPTPTPKQSSGVTSPTGAPPSAGGPAETIASGQKAKTAGKQETGQTEVEEVVLGAQEQPVTPAPTTEATGSAWFKGLRTPALAAIFIVPGTLLLGFAGWSFFQKAVSAKIDPK